MIDEIISKIKKGISENDLAVFLFDYDGTLTPIVDRPEDALLSEQVRSLLKKLSVKGNTVVSVVTGRGLNDIKNFINLDLTYITNHGYLTEYNGEIISHDPFFNKAKHYQIKYDDIFESLVGRYPGVQLEKKEVSTSFHYRNVEELKQKECKDAIVKKVKSFFAPRELRIKEGKKVIELVPFKEMNKGIAISDFLMELKKEFKTEKIFAMFIGDDLTDEDGFNALNKAHGLTIKVGDGKTLAQERLASVEDVEKLLIALNNI